MKEIGSIVIGIALGLVTSIVSNYATNYAKKRKTLFLSIFFALTASAIALAAWPEPQKQANVNIMNAKVDYDSLTAPAHVNDNKAYCAQSVRLSNSGERETTIASVKAVLSFRRQQFVVSASRTGVHQFVPRETETGLYNITLLPLSAIGNSSFGEIPRTIAPSSVIDILLEVAFEYDQQQYDLHSVFLTNQNASFDLVDLRYTFVTADGKEISTTEIPCFLLETKTVMKAP